MTAPLPFWAITLVARKGLVYRFDIARFGRRQASRALLSRQTVFVSLAVVLVVRVTVEAPAARGDLPAMQVIAQDGFGDSQNSYAWSMAWFRGALYVGTARSALCVERATIAFYFPRGSYYNTEPLQGVACPPTIDDADLRAEIWRYAPLTGRWTRVYRSPTVPNPDARGRGVARDIGYRGMAVLKQRGRRPTLYIAGVSANEFIPGLSRRYPPRILRTTDGRHFRPLKAWSGVIHDPFGSRRPIGYRAMTALHGKLYVTASDGLLGNGAALRIDRPGSSSPSFRQVTPANLAVFELATFHRHLYAGTGDFEHGYGVWRADGGRRLRWTPVVTDGAGRGAVMTSVVSMEPYRRSLYVGASGWGTSALPASELIRINASGGWDVVVGEQRQLPNGVAKAPVSGLPEGFGNPFNNHFWRMQTYRGALLLGTNDWSWSLAGNAGVDDSIRSEFGFDLYGTCNGDDWWRATGNGFGRPDDFGVRTMSASRAGLFLGTTNLVDGTTIRRSSARPCPAASRAAVRLRPGLAAAGHRLGVRRMSPFPSDLSAGTALSRRDAHRLAMRIQGR